MILECDIGNTECKWRIVDDNHRVLESGRFQHAEYALSEFRPTETFIRARAVSVVCGVFVDQLTQWVRSEYHVEIEWAKTQRETAGVRNSYDDISRLGVDRWVASVAAFQEVETALIVVDAGSALTVDVVNQAGVHKGGYIIPGSRLMKQSLQRDTDGVRFDRELHSAGIAFAASTGQAVHAGVRLALVGAVRLAIEEAEAHFGEVTVFLTGGDAKDLRAYLNTGVHYRSDLVLDGLRWLLP